MNWDFEHNNYGFGKYPTRSSQMWIDLHKLEKNSSLQANLY